MVKLSLHMVERLNCLKHCKALCCDNIEEIVFGFTPGEAQMIVNEGGEVAEDPMGYKQMRLCPGREGTGCKWHGTEKQPECCVNQRVGGEFCMDERKRAGLREV